MPKVSVIIPTYNMAHYLPAAIESALAQTYKDLEVVVIDDGSTDKTDEAIMPYLDQIILLKQVNGGPSKARNLGIRNASGDFVAFLDADDIWFPDKLEKQLQLFQKNPSYALVHSNVLIKTTDNSQPEQLWFDRKSRVKAGEIFSELLSQCFIIPSSVIVKKEILEKTDLFDENLRCWEGYDLWLKLAHKHPIGFITAPLLERRLHDSNLFYSNPLRDILSLIHIMQKWGAASSNLSRSDRATIKKSLEYNYFRLGRYYLANGHSVNARKALRRSLSHGFSLIGLAYIGLSVLPSTVLQWIRKAKRPFDIRTTKVERI